MPTNYSCWRRGDVLMSCMSVDYEHRGGVQGMEAGK